MDTLWQAVVALVPSVGVGWVFFIAIRSLVRADRNERAAMAKLDRDATAAVAEGMSVDGAPTAPDRRSEDVPDGAGGDRDPAMKAS